MKLYYIAPCRTSFPSKSASSIHMMKMCEAYSKLGYSVSLVLSDAGVSEQEIKSYYGISEKFNIIRVKVPAGKIGNIAYIIKSLYILAGEKAFLFVGRSVSVLSLLCFLGKKVTIDIHGPVWEFNKLDYFLFKKAIKLKNLNKLTVNSNALKCMYLERDEVSEDKIFVAHNGGDFVFIDDKNNIKNIRLNDKLNVGYFGGLYKGRGVELILDLSVELSEFNFHIFGGGEKDIERLQRGLSNVYFHGHMPHQDIPYYREQCDILVAPYSASGVAVSGGAGDSSKYMSPIKVVEYMSSGKAIVVSDLPVLKEILDDNSAIFATPDDINSWKEALVKLKSHEVRDKIGNNAKDKFLQGLTWQARANKLI